ncbi:MAG: DUF2284 domain-containing protein [Clostridiaceae bacterium]|nr:DUF2284 domain-containing protein [Clostridiaceae bacterium]
MDLENNYRIEQFETQVPVKEYVETCVNIDEFLEYCKDCRNYGTVWSCPPFDFSPEKFWNSYDTLYLWARKIIFSPLMVQADYTAEQLQEITKTVMRIEKQKMSGELAAMEAKHPQSMALSAGHCMECEEAGCTRPHGTPCREPGKMRYSIEALGGNVGLTITKYMKLQLLWIEEGRLPDYFILVGGLLMKDS